MSNRTDIVVETDNAEGQVLLSASRVYDLTEDKTQDTINSEIRNTLNQLVRPNLLDNWYFIGGGSNNISGAFPINQRGQNSYSNAGYTIDRWYLHSSGMEMAINQQDKDSIIVGTGSLFRQLIENGYDGLTGKTCTFSVLVGNVLLSASGIISASEGPSCVSDHTDVVSYVYTEAGPKKVSVCIENKTGGGNVKAAKLELGSGQTLAHQENGIWVLNEIPDYDEQLYRCCASTADSTDVYANRPYNPVAVSTGISGVYAYTSGSVVTIMIDKQVSTSASEWVTLGTLPDRLRPPNFMHFAAYDNDALSFSDSNVIAGYIDADGYVKVFAFSDKLSFHCRSTVTYLSVR